MIISLAYLTRPVGCNDRTARLPAPERTYAQFCFREGLKQEQDIEKIRKYMIVKANARVQVKQVDVVSGLRFANEAMQLEEAISFEADGSKKGSSDEDGEMTPDQLLR